MSKFKGYAVLEQTMDQLQWKDAALYRLSPPMSYQDEDMEYVIASTVEAGETPLVRERECLIFPATKDGRVITWAEVTGTYGEEAAHYKALAQLGYTFVGDDHYDCCPVCNWVYLTDEFYPDRCKCGACNCCCTECGYLRLCHSCNQYKNSGAPGASEQTWICDDCAQPAPLIKEFDPELEALLDEEERIANQEAVKRDVLTVYQSSLTDLLQARMAALQVSAESMYTCGDYDAYQRLNGMAEGLRLAIKLMGRV